MGIQVNTDITLQDSGLTTSGLRINTNGHLSLSKRYNSSEQKTERILTTVLEYKVSDDKAPVWRRHYICVVTDNDLSDNLFTCIYDALKAEYGVENCIDI